MEKMFRLSNFHKKSDFLTFPISPWTWYRKLFWFPISCCFSEILIGTLKKIHFCEIKETGGKLQSGGSWHVIFPQNENSNKKSLEYYFLFWVRGIVLSFRGKVLSYRQGRFLKFTFKFTSELALKNWFFTPLRYRQRYGKNDDRFGKRKENRF